MNTVKKTSSVTFPSLLNEIFKNDFYGGTQFYGTSLPAVNILANETAFVLELAVPGLKKEDMSISVDNNVLTIASESKTGAEDKQGVYSRREFNFASFKRSFTLSDTIDEEGIQAGYEDGILTVTLPKRIEELPKGKKVISII